MDDVAVKTSSKWAAVICALIQGGRMRFTKADALIIAFIVIAVAWIWFIAQFVM
jgi:hypothetical protein